MQNGVTIDPLMRIMRDFGDPFVPSEQAQRELVQEEEAKEEKHLSINQLRCEEMRVKPANVHRFAMVDSRR